MTVTYSGQKLCVGTTTLLPLADIEDLKTPAYLYDLDEIKQRILEFKNAFKTVLHSIHYAVKANTHSEVLKFIASQGIGADVVSGGELKAAVEAGFKPEQIIFSGVAKSRTELEYAIKLGIVQINVESLSELKRILEIATRLNLPAPVALRINPQVNPVTHPYIATGFKDNKFGLDTSHLAEAFSIILQSDLIKLKGLAIHIGSQLLDFGALKEALELSLKLMSDFNLSELLSFDVGGGLGIRYEENGDNDSLALINYAKVIKDFSTKFNKLIRIEPGRFLVARSGVLLSEIQYIKKTPHKTFVIANSGMNHLIRPALYQAVHRILPLEKRAGETFLADVVGPICESSDFLGKDCQFTPLNEGDILAILDTGAYGFSMASRYNLHDWPETYLKENNQFRRAESKF